jgi:hypothetical protein
VATEQKERRLNRRYPMAADFSYIQVDANSGRARERGRIVNMSAYGVLFDADRVFKRGTKLELTIRWPGGSEPSSSLTAVINGPVVRSNKHATAIAIETYEFKPLAHSAAT